ncbi:MAG: hypothetical protein NTW86_25370, partial [Candidatus Sumerlaeota bacterium]|nr:hypothetical protein [Candidatus Sumerlaeota bacterium]
MRIGSLPQSLAAVLSRFGFSAILLGLLLCVFGPVVAGRQTFFSNLYGTLEAGNYFANPGGRQGYFTTRDSAGMQFIEFPALRVARESLRRGELPLWNPYTGLGRPLIGEMLGSLLNPLKLPLWLWPTQYAFDLYLMGRLLLAGVFLWLLARRVGISPTGAAIAGCAYALNGYFLTYLTQWHLACDVWFPLFLYLVVEARAGHLAKGVLGGAVCWGCMILAGNPQPLLIYLLFAFWFGWAALRQSGEPGGGAAWLREVAVWTLSVLGGAALAAPFLVEALPFYFHARQFHTTGFHLYGNSFVECLWRAVGLQVYWIARSLFPLGVAPLVLGALTLSRRQWRRPLTLALLVFFAIFQMKLLPGVRWLSPLHWIAFAPPFNQILWIKYQGAAYLGLSLLAGFGWDSFARNPSLETGSRERSNGLPRWKRRHWIGFGLVAAAALLA